MTSPNTSNVSLASSRELITKTFKRKLKKVFNKESKSLRSPNTSESAVKKNVSWADKCGEQHSDKPFRSTPFPHQTKKLKTNKSIPVALAFDESDEELNFTDDSFIKSGDISNIFTINTVEQKPTKRGSKWTVTSCGSDIKPDKRNAKNWREKNLLLARDSKSSIILDSHSENILETSCTTENSTSSSDIEAFDPDDCLAKTIMSNIRRAGVIAVAKDSVENGDDPDVSSEEELWDYVEYSDTEFENNDSPEGLNNENIICQKVIVTDSKQLARIAFDDSSCENTSNNTVPSSPGQPEEYFYSVISKKSCQIIEPELSVKMKDTKQKTNNVNANKKNKNKIEHLKRNVAETESNDEPPSVSQNNVSEDFDDSKTSDKSDISDPSIELTESQSDEPLKGVKVEELIKYHVSRNHCILVLKHPVKLYIHGKLAVTILTGTLEVLGHVLEYDNGNEVEIYSPRGSCILCMETLDSKKNINLAALLKGYNMTDEQIEELCVDMKEDDCIIAAKNIRNDLTAYFDKHVAQQLYPKVFEDDRPLADLELKLKCLFEVQPSSWKVYKPNREWPGFVNSVLLNETNNLSKILICGGKSVGKSVLFRYMINSMLNSVAKVVCIDVDLGQSEFTIGGCVSVTIVDKPVYGPNYTHLRKPDKSFFVGQINVVQCLDRYLTCVKQLLAYCDENIDKNIPWVINYMGFTKSVGTDLIVAMIKILSPTHVVQIQSGNNNRNYSAALNVNYVQNYKTSVPVDIPNTKPNYILKILNSEADHKMVGEWEYEPRQIREMSILAYFSQILQGTGRITNIPPYVVKMSSIELRHISYRKGNMPAALNGNLVALCKINPDETTDNESAISCIGFGIVRGVDTENDNLYLLTPVHEKELETVNCLSMGQVAVPPSIYMTPGHEGLVPYIHLGTTSGTSLIPKRSFRSCKSILKKQ